ncbi:MAG: T9SS type A sorting domain-containing protein [Bacteroidales bacterium]|nr:T9SS type A sorting domain-containing protein [Bacteroidales bacterium]
MKKALRFTVLFLLTVLLTKVAFNQVSHIEYAYDGNGCRTSTIVVMLEKSGHSSASDVVNIPIKPTNDKYIDFHNLKVYPNPTKGELKIEITYSELKEPIQIETIITSINGEELLDTYFFNEVVLDISHYASGTYILVIKTANQKETIKLIKK